MAGKDKPPVLTVVDSAKKPEVKKPNGKSGGGGGKGSDKPTRFGEYFIKDGMFYLSKIRSDGEISEIALCNFTCRIVEQVIAEDGLTDAAFFRIEGQLANTRTLPLAVVSSNDFFNRPGSWPNEVWGLKPIIYPGLSKKEHLKLAIQQFSELKADVPTCIIYKYTGWKKIDADWHFLTGSGAISSAGLVEGVQVDLGAGHMGHYALPPPLAGDALKQAWQDARLLLDICPSKPHIGAALLAAVARAPLGECQATDFAIWLHGLTGSRKSAIAAIALAFFGRFTARSFPANWSDTVNNIEIKSHAAKDSIFVIDDFKPGGSRKDADELFSKAQTIIINTGNQAGRGRCDVNMQAKAAPFNRSLMLITAEDLPRGASVLARLLVLELSKADVDNPVLTKLQKAAKAESFSGLMSAYLQWLASQLDRLKIEFPESVELFRNGAFRDGFALSHPRAPEIYANLVAGAETFLEFLEAVGAINHDESLDLMRLIETSLQDAFMEQGSYQAEQDEIERFLRVLRAVFTSGNGHIRNRLDQGPPTLRPYAWGWREGGFNELGEKIFNPVGDCLGWHCEPVDNKPAEIWLTQETTLKAVQQFARADGEPFLINASTLWRRLQEKGLILETEKTGENKKPRTSVKKSIAGNHPRVMILAAELIESG